MLSLLIFFHISISISYFLYITFFSSFFSYFLLLTMADNNNNNNNVSAGSGSSSRGTTNRGRNSLYYVTRPPPRVEGDASNKTKGPKYPGMQDVFGIRPGKWSFDFAPYMFLGFFVIYCLLSSFSSSSFDLGTYFLVVFHTSLFVTVFSFSSKDVWKGLCVLNFLYWLFVPDI